MKLDPTLKPQKRFNRARLVGINPNHWYPVGRSELLKRGSVQKTVLWQKEIALYRGSDGVARAMDDACMHKGVALSKGEVEGDELVCPYHGWCFNGQGACVAIPYWEERKHLPKTRIPTYPVRERYGLIWLFPGDAQIAAQTPLPDVPEYDDPNWLIVLIPARFKVHYSVVNENPLDVFHGHLHRDLQGWYNPVLKGLERDDESVRAVYEVTFRNSRLARFIGLTQSGEAEVQKEIHVGCYYPHCRNTLPGKSNYYFMRQPTGPNETLSYSLLCLKVRLPKLVVDVIRKPLALVLWRFMVKPFLDQDIEVMESEQRVFEADPNRHYVEINPVIAAAQQLILNQYDAYAGSNPDGDVSPPAGDAGVD